ncbi:MAG: hypothetical protein PHD48_06035 [Alphaproteobacteria bacterium]|nr:hypothetical protein [Alphaproteobacteria bacterium]
MIIEFFCTNPYFAKKKRACETMLTNVREVYQLNGRVAPDKAALFITAYNLHLVRLLEWADVPEGKDPYKGTLRSFDKLPAYPLCLRKNLYRSVMRGIPMPIETKVSALRHALGLQDDASDPCCFSRLPIESKTISKMLQTCMPVSSYKARLLKRLRPRPNPTRTLCFDVSGPVP